MKTGGRRVAFTLIELMMVICILVVIYLIAAPAYQKYKMNAFTRTCFQQQKTLSCALQNYNLDYSQGRTDVPEVFKTLKEAGYLQTMPADPSFGPDSFTNYKHTATGFGIRCSKHGQLK